MKRHTPKPAITLNLVGMLLLASAVKAKGAEKIEEGLHVIVLEGELNPEPVSAKRYDVVEAPADFPQRFSRLLLPTSPQSISLPELPLHGGVHLVDIYTFDLTKSGQKQDLTLSHLDKAIHLSYEIRIVSWGDQFAEIKLDGIYEKARYTDLAVHCRLDRTNIVVIPNKGKKKLFFALTPLSSIPLVGSFLGKLECKECQDPKLISGPTARYPEKALKPGTEPPTGRVIIKILVAQDGTLDPEQFFVSQCPNYWLGRSAVETIFKYRFRPGTTNDGKPRPVLATIELSFNFVEINTLSPYPPR